MQNIRKLAAGIVAREGGYVHDPDDPGGATKYGVTLGTMRRLGVDLDGDGEVGLTDLKRLTRARAVDLFVAHYFTRPGLGRLPAPLAETVFDMQVNAGDNAVRLLQRLLADMGHRLAADGRIGPVTAAAAKAAALAAPDHLADAYGIARRNYYYRLGDRRPVLRKYARSRSGGKGGWITRAEGFIAPRYHLNGDEHRQRVSAWA